MYLGWYDPDKKKPARLKIEAAVERFTEKWGKVPTQVICHAQDAQDAGEIPGLTIEVRSWQSRHTFYVGGEE